LVPSNISTSPSAPIEEGGELINECGIEAKRLLKYYDRENKGNEN